MLIVLSFFTSSDGVSAARSLAAPAGPLRIKLDLTRLDFPHAGNVSYARLQQAQHHSSLRLAGFHHSLAGGAAASLSSTSSAPSSYTAPVFADSDKAAFLTTLSLGTPPVSFNAIVDTGSDLVWLQCKPCSACFTNHGAHTIFAPSQSSTYSVLPCSNSYCNYLPHASCSAPHAPCTYQQSYGDQSYTVGDLSLDTLTLPDPSGTLQHIASFAFGCGHDNQGDFSSGAGDGILGLGLGPLSMPSQLGISHLSYCLQSVTNPSSASQTSPLYLGDAAQGPRGGDGLTITTRFFTNPTLPITDAPFYYVNLTGISVGGQLVTTSSDGAFDIHTDGRGGTIFDSGTTITLLESNAYKAIVDAFTSAIALPPTSISTSASTLCYELSSASNIEFPSLTFHFEDADLQLPLNNYFLASKADNLMCLTIGHSNQPLSIIGNMQQQNFFITYDLQAHTLSLTPSTCES